MPGATFDALLRNATRALSRRGVLGTGFSALMASLLTMFGLRAVDQAAAKKKKHKRKKKTCAKAGQKPKNKHKHKKRCCKGLSKDATGRCAKPCDVQASGSGTLQAAIDGAAPGASITLCAGTFNESIDIAKDLTLIGAGDGPGTGNTILEGMQSHVVTIAPDTTVTLQNLRLTGGGELTGGGLLNDGTVTLIECTVSANNAGGAGGGVDNRAGATMTLTNCAVSANNAVDSGGGISNSGMLTLIGSTVSANLVDDSGGGISNNGTLDLTDSSVTANTAGNASAGIRNRGIVICNGGSTVSGNTVGSPPAESNCIDVDGGTGCATCPA